MKTISILVLLSAGAFAAGAQNTEFTAWMKQTKAASEALQKGDKTGVKAMENAERLGGIYENMIGYWRQRNAEPAVKISTEGKAAAAELASAAHAGDAERASAALKTIGATCQSCHQTYREKLADGSYRIK
jgi:cytochrome c556